MASWYWPETLLALKKWGPVWAHDNCRSQNLKYMAGSYDTLDMQKFMGHSKMTSSQLAKMAESQEQVPIQHIIF